MKEAADGAEYWRELYQRRMQWLANEALSYGVVVEVVLEPQQPLAMGNYLPIARARLARERR